MMNIRLLAAGLPRPNEPVEERAKRICVELRLLRDYRRAIGRSHGASANVFREVLRELDAQANRLYSDEHESYWESVARHAGRVEREARKIVAAQRARRLVPELLEAGVAEVVQECELR